MNNQELNTSGFQSMLISYYTPTGDHQSLDYTSAIYFPLVKWGKFDPWEGETWRIRYKDHHRLELPVPLQYEGDYPWPAPEPGRHSVERCSNQGTQILDLSGEGLLTIMYAGLH